MVVLVSPALEEACEELLNSIAARRMVVVVALCTVNYSGRSGSRLGEGERMIVLKEDGCVLIHRSRDYRPVNWQPSGSLIQAKIQDGHLLLRAVRPDPIESLSVLASRVQLLVSFRLQDNADFVLGGSEQDMQDAILSEPDIIEEGLQVMDFEKKVEPGFVDVYAVDSMGNTVVIEIKKDPASIAAVRQLSEYLKYIPANYERKIRPMIVAPSLAKGAQSMMSRMGIEFKPLTLQKSLEILQKRGGSDQKKLRKWIEEAST